MEKEYKDLSKIAKKGINKYTRLSYKGMMAYRELYRKKTNKNPSDVNNKESYYSFVAKNKIRK